MCAAPRVQVTWPWAPGNKHTFLHVSGGSAFEQSRPHLGDVSLGEQPPESSPPGTAPCGEQGGESVCFPGGGRGSGEAGTCSHLLAPGAVSPTLRGVQGSGGTRRASAGRGGGHRHLSVSRPRGSGTWASFLLPPPLNCKLMDVFLLMRNIMNCLESRRGGPGSGGGQLTRPPQPNRRDSGLGGKAEDALEELARLPRRRAGSARGRAAGA